MPFSTAMLERFLMWKPGRRTQRLTPDSVGPIAPTGLTCTILASRSLRKRGSTGAAAVRPSVCRPNAFHQRWPSKGRMPITFNCCAHTTSRGTMSEARGAGTISPRSALLISPYPFSVQFCCNSPDQVYQHGQTWLWVRSTIYQVFIDWQGLVFRCLT